MSSSSTRLSVIIPGYKTPETWWRRCVTSVQRAMGPDDEIICVDDGSPQKPTFLDEMALADTRIRVVYLPVNQGQGAARNRALELARGDYVTFVDSDDEVRPPVYLKCIESLMESNCDIALFGVQVVWVDEGLAKVDLPPERVYGRLAPHDIQDLSRLCLFNYPCNKIYRHSFLSHHGLIFDPQGMPCEDTLFNLECVIAGAAWCTVPRVGYVYYRQGCTSLARYKKFYAYGLKSCSELWQRYKEQTPGAEVMLKHFGELSEDDLILQEWRNLWRPGSPCSFMVRWRFLVDHAKSFGRPLIFVFVRQFCFSFLRRWCYVRPIRRWHIRRMYPQAKDVDVNMLRNEEG